MSFILDALRKSENERQKAAVPGISDIPAVVHRNRIPGWMLGVMAGLTACTLLLGWAWLEGVGEDGQGAVAGTPVQAQPAESLSTPTADAAGSGNVRSLAREARQPSSSDSRPSGPAAASAAPVQRVSPSGAVVTMAELQASGATLPEINLELHVFSPSPGERFVFINSAKYLEGESLPEGPRLLEITEDGVVMSHRNQSFLLPRE